MKKLLFLLLLPTLSFADRLGSLRSGADVLLSSAGIKNSSTLQTGATAYPDFLNVGSSGTIGTGGLSLRGKLDVNRPDLTGFSGGSRLYFDPAAANSLLRLQSQNNTSTSNTISFLNASSLSYASIDMGVNAGSFQITHSSVAPDGVGSGAPVNRWSANPAGSQTFYDHTGTAIFTIDKSSVSMASFNATATSMTVTGSGGMAGAGLSACGDSTHALSWSAGQFGCQAITAAGGGSGSPIAITTGPVFTYANPAISTPMLVGVYDQSQFGILATGTTAFITIAFSTISVSATYTAFSTNSIVLADATGGAFTVTLSTMNSNGSSIQIGKVYTVSRVNSGANAVTVAGATGTIDGDATQVLNTQWGTIDVFWEGQNWGIR